MGKSLIFFASGLGFQELGQLTYSYYIYVLNIEVPYPSFGDIFYYGSIIFYILGVLYLAKASGVQVSLKSVKGKINALLIPIVILLLSYYVFLQGYEFDWSQFLTIILDFGYPLGQAIYVSLAFLIYLLTRGVLGGLMRPKILFVLVALLAQYLADWTFLYQASRGTWSVSGINDYMYFFAYFLMALALIQFDTVYKKLHEKK